MKILFLVALLMALSNCDRILVIMDSKSFLNTHSDFFKLLEKGNTVEFAYSFDRNNIELRYFDQFRYEHIVVMCTSAKGIPSGM